MDSVLPIVVASIVLGAVIAIIFFGNYFSKRKSEVASISKPELQPEQKKPSNPSQAVSKKFHSHGADKDQNKRHHALDVNTLKGHADSVTGICFSHDGRSLATDGAVRVFKLNDASSKSFKFLRINLPASGGHPTAVTFGDNVSSVVVASETLSGSALYMYGEEKPQPANGDNHQTKLP